VAPGRADRVDGSVRAVVRDASCAAEGDGAAQRAGWRRAARRLRAVPLRLPARAGASPQAQGVRARSLGVARRAEATGQAAALRPSARAADQAAAAPRVPRRARVTPVPAFAGRPQGAPRRRLADVLVAVAAALRGSQLDGVLDGVTPSLPRPGAR